MELIFTAEQALDCLNTLLEIDEAKAIIAKDDSGNFRIQVSKAQAAYFTERELERYRRENAELKALLQESKAEGESKKKGTYTIDPEKAKKIEAAKGKTVKDLTKEEAELLLSYIYRSPKAKKRHEILKRFPELKK